MSYNVNCEANYWILINNYRYPVYRKCTQLQLPSTPRMYTSLESTLALTTTTMGIDFMTGKMLFYPATEFTLLENMKICYKIQVIINQLKNY